MKKAAIEREKSQTRLSYSEREQARGVASIKKAASKLEER